MKTYASALALLTALTLSASALAQDATPTPDPLVYDDAAMHYQAPAGAHLIGMKQITLDELPQDPTPVATWVVGTGNNARIISIVMQSFTGSLDGFDSTWENGLRNDDPATLVKNKERAQLQNGMPALFLDVTTGAGFSTRKIFAYLWIDSQRAVVLSVSATLSGLDANEAKRLLFGATAVRYPGQ